MTRKCTVFDRFAYKLAKARLGINSDDEVARQASISSSAFHSMVWGKVPKDYIRDRIAAVLRVAVSDLYREATYTSSLT